MENENQDEVVKRMIEIRKHFNLTQSKFAERIGLTRSTISLIESGGRVLTERTIGTIVDRFNVNYDWLMTGEGEPYIQNEHNVLDLLAAEYNLDALDVEILKHYLSLSPLEREVFKSFIKKIKSTD